MGAKVFILFFALVAAVAAQDAEILRLPGIPTLPDIHNSISDSMKKLMDDAQAATTLATSASTLAKALKTNADERVKDATLQVAEVMTGVQQQLQKSGGDVTKLQSCSQEEQSNLRAFQGAALANVTGCITEKTSKAAISEARLFNASQIIFVILTEIGDQIQSRCPIPTDSTPESSAQHAFCTMNVIGYADGVVAKQSTIISNNIAEYTALVDSLSTLQADLTACFTTKATEAALVLQPIIDKIVACALL